MSEQHLASEIHSWTTRADRWWFARCGLCHRRRLVADYFEGYLWHDGKSVWLRACSGCLMDEISDRLDEEAECYQDESRRTPSCRREEHEYERT